jgi:hypothetical protein
MGAQPHRTAASHMPSCMRWRPARYVGCRNARNKLTVGSEPRSARLELRLRGDVERKTHHNTAEIEPPCSFGTLKRLPGSSRAECSGPPSSSLTPTQPAARMRPRTATRLRQEIGHTALWRLMYLAGGCVAILSFYLAAGGQAFDQLPPSICSGIAGRTASQRVRGSAVWLRVMTTAPPPRGF